MKCVWKSWAPALAFGLIFGAAAPALAGPIVQPNNVTVPTGNGLQGVFNGLGENISVIPDAEVEPERFLSTCAATFKVHARMAAYQNSFGWYNVTGTKPTPSELYELIACDDPVGSSASSPGGPSWSVMRSPRSRWPRTSGGCFGGRSPV